MIRKSELQQLILAGASERQIQSLLKKDLSMLAEVYAHPSYDYICFSEFPVNNGCVDFAIFTGVSWMTVILIEVKGADFNIVNQSGTLLKNNRFGPGIPYKPFLARCRTFRTFNNKYLYG